MQFSEKKAEYTIGIARAFLEGRLDKEKIASLPDLAARKKALTDHKGIGVWTANYALMKSLKEPECIPHGDIGLLNALSYHNIINDRKEQEKIDALFSAFAGWESYLVFYLWRSLAVKQLT
jgi:DNA-3-methyladenine glycosylase II